MGLIMDSKLVGQKRYCSNLFVKDVTGERMAGTPGNGHFDPKLGVDALKSRDGSF
jgi:hypothetical protein